MVLLLIAKNDFEVKVNFKLSISSYRVTKASKVTIKYTIFNNIWVIKQPPSRWLITQGDSAILGTQCCL